MTIAEETELLVATRRDLHRHPELGFHEHRTAGIAAERLRAAGYEVRTGLAVTGVVGTLRGGAGDGPTLLLRADMDALPVDEETEHDFRSTVEGKMHACGHDAHVAIGLAVAERLARAAGIAPSLAGRIYLPLLAGAVENLRTAGPAAAARSASLAPASGRSRDRHHDRRSAEPHPPAGSSSPASLIAPGQRPGSSAGTGPRRDGGTVAARTERITNQTLYEQMRSMPPERLAAFPQMLGEHLRVGGRLKGERG